MDDQTITDQDLDAVLEEGRRTSAQTNALLEADAIRKHGGYPKDKDREASSGLRALLAMRGVRSY